MNLNSRKIYHILFIVITFYQYSCSSEKNDNSNLSKQIEIINTNKGSITNFENENIFNNLQDTTLLSKLFDNPIITEDKVALWKPNYYERMSIGVSYDGYCHTNIDTIMYFTSIDSVKNACVIFSTFKYNKDDNIGDCHFCGVPLSIALFQENKEQKWELYKFEKHFSNIGHFGEIRKDKCKISLIEIGDKWTCLSLKDGISGNMGEYEGFENLYSIEKYLIYGFPNKVLSNIFSYKYHSKSIDINDEIIGEINSEISFIKKEKSHYPLILKINENGKIKTEEYRYSIQFNQYVRLSKKNR